MRRLYIPKSGQLLLGSPNTDPDLLLRLELCGVPTDWGWNFCRTAGCHRCRKHRVKFWILDALKHLTGSDPRHLRMVTVMLDPTADVGSVKASIDRGKVQWRNLVYRLRLSDERAKKLRIIGVAEVDWYHASHVHRLSGYKKTQLESLGFDVTAEEVWMPHFHLLVDLAGFPGWKFEEAVERQWPGSRQVDVQPLDSFRPLEQNVARVLAYATKHKHFYKIDPFHDPAFVRWPERAITSYYNMLFKAGGFSLLRFHLKPAKEKTTKMPRLTKQQAFREPMPVIMW